MQKPFLVMAVIGLALLGSSPCAWAVGFGIGTNDWAGGAPPGPAGLAPHGSSLRGPILNVPHETHVPGPYGGGRPDPLGSSYRLPSSPMLFGPHGAATHEPAKPAVFESRGMPYHTLNEGRPLVPHGLPVRSLQGMPLPGPSFPAPREAAYVNTHGYPGFRRTLESPAVESIGNEPFRFASTPSASATPNWLPVSPAWSAAPAGPIDDDAPLGAEWPAGPSGASASFFCMAPARPATEQEATDRASDSRPKPFNAAWYAEHPKAWRLPGPITGATTDFTVAGAAAWLGTRRTAPLVMTLRVVPTATSDANAARSLANSGGTSPPANGRWLLIGKFAIRSSGERKATRVLGLAVNPDGLVRGISCDLNSNETENLVGAVDKTDLRIAWTAEPGGELVFQTTLSELTVPEGKANAFGADGRVTVWRIGSLLP